MAIRCARIHPICRSPLSDALCYSVVVSLGASGLYLLLYRGGNPLEWFGLGGGGDAGADGADGGGDHASSAGSAGTVKIIEFGDAVVMATIWSAGVLLAAHALEFIDFTVRCGAYRRFWLTACTRIHSRSAN
jgi:hypothetical protein